MSASGFNIHHYTALQQYRDCYSITMHTQTLCLSNAYSQLLTAAYLSPPCFSSPPQGETPQIERTLSHVVRSASITSEVQGAFVQCAPGVTITVFAGIFCASFGPVLFWL